MKLQLGSCINFLYFHSVIAAQSSKGEYLIDTENSKLTIAIRFVDSRRFHRISRNRSGIEIQIYELPTQTGDGVYSTGVSLLDGKK